MKVLIIGRGVVGTIYAWALSKTGIDVTHIVRKEGLPATDTLDLLDLRPGFPKHTRVIYAPKTIRRIGPSDGFDLVIVAAESDVAALQRTYALGVKIEMRKRQISRTLPGVSELVIRSADRFVYSRVPSEVDQCGVENLEQ
jgi:malate/lactate dehydrogenase